MSNYKEDASLFKAFCDERRLQIIETLKNGELCACNILDALPISQSTLSHHMKILVESGLVASRKEGKWVHYKIDVSGLNRAQELLNDMRAINDSNDGCTCSAE